MCLSSARPCLGSTERSLACEQHLQITAWNIFTCVQPKHPGLEDAAAVCASFSDSALLLSLPRSRLRSASFDDALHDLSLGPLATATAASLAARAFMFLNQHPAPRRSVPGTWLWAAT